MAQHVDEAEFMLDPAKWHRHAEDEPVVITVKDQPKLYLMSKEVFDSLYKGSRRTMKVGELDERAKKALREAEVPAEFDYLEALMEEEP